MTNHGKNSRRNVKSSPITINAHEKGKDFITETELEELVQGAKKSRHRWRDTAILRVMFWHGLRVSELCNLRRSDLDFKSGQLYVRRVKGGLSTHQPLRGDELRALKRYLKERSSLALPWVFITERGEQFTRYGIKLPVTGNLGAFFPAFPCPSPYASARLRLCAGQSGPGYAVDSGLPGSPGY